MLAGRDFAMTAEENLDLICRSPARGQRVSTEERDEFAQPRVADLIGVIEQRMAGCLEFQQRAMRGPAKIDRAVEASKIGHPASSREAPAFSASNAIL